MESSDKLHASMIESSIRYSPFAARSSQSEKSAAAGLSSVTMVSLPMHFMLTLE